MSAYLGGSSNMNILPGRGLVNPAFTIKMVAATDSIQQPAGGGRNNPNDDYLSNLSTNDSVFAKVDGKEISGNISRIIKNSEGDVIYVVIIDNKGDQYKVEATAIKKRKNFRRSDNDDSLVSSPASFNESVLSFQEYHKF